jgi:hypothetical protein
MGKVVVQPVAGSEKTGIVKKQSIALVMVAELERTSFSLPVLSGISANWSYTARRTTRCS